MMRFSTVAVMVCMAGLLAISAGTLAVRPPDVGGGNGGGNDAGNEPPDYGDLFVLYRNTYGVPYLTPEDQNGGLCQQPLPSDTCPVTCNLVPGIANGVPTEVDVVPVDPQTCAVLAECALCTQESDFGRMNEVRSPDTVFESQMEDVIYKLATADCISLDPSGRPVASSTDPADATKVISAAIDSPLQSLAIYRQLMLKGYLGPEDYPIELPDDFMDTAARALGAASDKTGEFTRDMHVYINEFMGLTDPGITTVLGAPICIQVREEVMGVVQRVQKCFLNYEAYSYNRAANFAELPKPAYIPESAPVAGYFEYLALLDETLPSFYIYQGPILNAVFPDGEGGYEPGYMDGNIGGFVQAADDTRAVIEFMHNNPIPLGYETGVPLLCDISGEASYDVSISDVSGLQVPVRMVAGTEGREFSVTVQNEGDPAAGTVEVSAVDADGLAIPTFPRFYAFDLVGGDSMSWTEGFSIDYKTTVTWTATAVTDCASCDANPANNSVSETTTVTGGGGGNRPSQAH